MSGHRNYRRRRSSESWSSGSNSTSRPSTRDSTTMETDADAPGGHRQLKRPSTSSPVPRSPAPHPRSWVLLNRSGAPLDDFPGDSTASAMSRTSNGEEISVSFQLVQPPGTSVLTVVRPLATPETRKPSVSSVLVSLRPSISTTTAPRKFSGRETVIAAHRDVVLIAVVTRQERNSSVDFFVYHATRGQRPPSLMLLPSAYAGGPVIYPHLMGSEGMGIMSSAATSKDDDDDTPPSFVVAYLLVHKINGVRVELFRSESGRWEAFENVHVHGANGGGDLHWWSTDAAVPYGRRHMVWVDYYRGMVLMDLSSSSSPSSSSSEKNLPPPRLRYVPLPVDTVDVDPTDNQFGGRGGCPKASRSVCTTRHGIKFISVDIQRWSNFGVGSRHMFKWDHRFRITTWSLREDDYTWKKDATMHEEEFWDVFDGGDRRVGFPHVEPMFPVVDAENPDVVIFRLEERYGNDPKWMIEVDLRKKVLLAATSYSKESGLSGDAEAINYARVSNYDPIRSELPRYMDAGQAYKRRK